MNRFLILWLSACFLTLVACELDEPAVLQTQPWTQERVEALRMPGVVDEPGEIYRQAYERAMSQIDTENLEERLEAIEREIETERSELP